MWRFLVALGFLLAFAGLVVVALGMAIFVSSFGNTLIGAGAVTLSGGIVIIAVAMVLREVKALADRLDAALAMGTLPAEHAYAAPEEPELPLEAADEVQEEYAPEPEPEPEPLIEAPARPLIPTPPAFPRPRSFERPAAPPPFEPIAPAAGPVPDALRRGRVLGRTPEGEAFAARMRPSSDLPPSSAPDLPEPDRAFERNAPTERSPLPERAPLPVRGYTPPARRADPAPPAAPEPSILKSGIVGGMAYTLYSDGSIQAELPDGSLRFASLQELRDHVARSSQPN